MSVDRAMTCIKAFSSTDSSTLFEADKTCWIWKDPFKLWYRSYGWCMTLNCCTRLFSNPGLIQLVSNISFEDYMKEIRHMQSLEVDPESEKGRISFTVCTSLQRILWYRRIKMTDGGIMIIMKRKKWPWICAWRKQMLKNDKAKPSFSRLVLLFEL